MSERRKSRRSLLKAAAGIAAGSALPQRPLWAQGVGAAATFRPDAALGKVDRGLTITPDQAWEWNAFKAECGPTYAGSAGWKRYTDFLVAKMQEFGAIDLDSVEIPYDHYIVDDWPDRGTHVHDSGRAIEKLVVDGKPVPVVASYGMTSGFTSAEGVTAPLKFYDPADPPTAAEIAGRILVFQTASQPGPPYSNAFLNNFTPTDYEWRSPGEWPPLFVPPPASVTSSYHCRWDYNSDKFHFYGEALMQRAMAYRAFADAGIVAAAGSDFGPGPFAPLMGIQGMVTRTGWNGETWGANQRISVAEALRVNTINGAYASHEEAIKGSIAPGKLADFVVLADDPHTVEPDRIKDIAIVRTVTGGNVVYQG